MEQDLFMQLRGVAARRGDEIADQTKGDRSQPWPEDSSTMRAVARARLGDLTRDDELLERLAEVLLRQAARRWNGQRASSASESGRA